MLKYNESFDSIEIDINPCDDDDIDEQIQIYVYNTLVNEFPDDKMNLILNEKEMRHYQDYGQGLKKCFNNSYCIDDNFNHETFIGCLRKILLYIKDNEQFIGNTIIDENKFDLIIVWRVESAQSVRKTKMVTSSME